MEGVEVKVVLVFMPVLVALPVPRQQHALVIIVLGSAIDLVDRNHLLGRGGRDPKGRRRRLDELELTRRLRCAAILC